MKKIFITFLLLMFTLVSYGQLLDDFESGTFNSGWTFYNAESGMTGVVNSWNVAKCDALPGGLKNFPSVCGNYVAYAQCGGGVNITDSWMITPKVTIKKGDFLKFALADPLAYSMTHDTLDVMVSETTADKSAFTVNVMRVIPRSSIPWKENSIDLSQFAGKDIYIGFRDYHYNRGSFMREYIFLDNISISQTPSYDLSMESVLSPNTGCVSEQVVKAVVKNNGAKTTRFTLSYQIDQDPEVSEVINVPLEAGANDTLSFSAKAVLKEGMEHAVKVWVKNDMPDSFVNNDTVATSVKIGKELPFPYQITDENGANDFTAIGSPANVWQFKKLEGTDKYAWVLFGKSTNLRVSLMSNCIPMSGEKVMLSFKYHASHDVSLVIYTGAPFANASLPVDTIQLPKSADFVDAQVMLALPGVTTSIGFFAQFPKATWSEYCELALSGISVDVARSDLAGVSVIEPAMTSLLASEEEHSLKVSFRNVGSGDIKGTDLCYQMDNNTIVREKNETVIPEGDNLEYLFTQKIILNQLGNHTLKVWSETYGDIKASNDTITRNFIVYQAESFPFVETFADSAENGKWSVINEDNDDVSWSFMKHAGAVKEGVLAYKNSISGITSNDYLVSPAVAMPVGKARLSFYYATSEYNKGTGKLKVLMGTDPDPKKMTTVLFDYGLTNTGWLNGYALSDIKEAGNYYFAFYGYGTSGDIYLDYIKVDASEDLCMNSIAFTETSGFNKSKSDVNISFINHGISSQDNIPVSYFIEGKLMSTETIAGPVLPGDTAVYTFKKQVDISVPDSTYRLMAKIDKVVGEDTFNDQMIGWAVEHWANKKIPYKQSFEKVTDIQKWYVPTTAKGWVFQNNMFYAYEGNYFLAHTNSTDVADAWIFSECIEIPAGTYELSFFYRTMKNMDTAPYKQKFKVMLGTGTSAAEMTLPVAVYDSITVATPAYKKHSGKIVIAQSGKYYLGFYNYSKPGSGNTCIENLEIKPVDAGQTLPYTADFTSRQSEWTIYNPSSGFYQWNHQISGFDDFMYVNRNDIYNQPEGMFVSPALAVEAGKDVRVTIDYAVISAVDSVRLNFYAGNVNNPDSMQLITKLAQSADFIQTTYEFKIPVGMPYYFGFHSNSLAQYELKLAGFKAEYLVEDAIHENSNALTVYVSQKDLHILSGEMIRRVTLTDVVGRCIYDNAQINNNQLTVSGIPSGVYILKLENEGRNIIRKIRIN